MAAAATDAGDANSTGPATMSRKAVIRRIGAMQNSTPENNKCMNCLEPQPAYICPEFRTFVCKPCGEIHREFGHKVECIANSDWTPAEFERVMKGGNKKAAQEWLAYWQPSEFRRPNNVEPTRMRNFIRKAYVVKCWQRQPKKPYGSASKAADAAAAGTDNSPTAATGTGQAATAPAPGGSSGNEVTQPSAATVQAQPVAALSVAPTVITQPIAGAAAPPIVVSAEQPQTLVLLPKDIACFCTQHDSTERRPKAGATLRDCSSCGLRLMTNYETFTFCPGCSARRELCMICGAVAPLAEQDRSGNATGNNTGGTAEVLAATAATQVPMAVAAPAQVVATKTDASPAKSGVGRVGNLMDMDLIGLDTRTGNSDTNQISCNEQSISAPRVEIPLIPAPRTAVTAIPATVGQSGNATPGDTIAANTKEDFNPDSQTNKHAGDLFGLDFVQPEIQKDLCASAFDTAPQWEAGFNSVPSAAIPPPTVAGVNGSALNDITSVGGVKGDLFNLDFSQPSMTLMGSTSQAAALQSSAELSPTATTSPLHAKAEEAPLGGSPVHVAAPGGAVANAAINAVMGAFDQTAMSNDQGKQTTATNRFSALDALQMPTQGIQVATASTPVMQAATAFTPMMQAATAFTPMKQAATAEVKADIMLSPSNPTTATLESQTLLSPELLNNLDSQDLVHMHAMLSQALQQRACAKSNPAVPTVPILTSPSKPAMPKHKSDDLGNNMREASATFGDLIHAFHEKNTTWENKHGSPAKAPSNITQGSPKPSMEFDNLLSAFHEKNPIAGFQIGA